MSKTPLLCYLFHLNSLRIISHTMSLPINLQNWICSCRVVAMIIPPLLLFSQAFYSQDSFSRCSSLCVWELHNCPTKWTQGIRRRISLKALLISTIYPHTLQPSYQGTGLLWNNSAFNSISTRTTHLRNSQSLTLPALFRHIYSQLETGNKKLKPLKAFMLPFLQLNLLSLCMHGSF